MATVTLDRGNFVVIGVQRDGSYEEKFGEIMDFRQDESDANTHWLKIKMMVDINQNTLIDEIQNYSSHDLGRVPKLEIYDAQEGSSILNHFTDRINRRAQETEARTRRAPRTLSPVPEADRNEQDIVEELMDENEPPIDNQAMGRLQRVQTFPTMDVPLPGQAPDQEARPMGIMPSRIGQPSTEIEPELKAFSINLATGDMKTIMQVAKKSPQKVFGIIDLAIKESGHNTINFIDEALRETFIQLKVENLKMFTQLELQKNTTYTISRAGESGYAHYMGDNFWVIPTNDHSLSEIDSGFKEIDPAILKEYMVQKTEDREGVVLGYCQPIIEQIDQDFKIGMEEQATAATITVMNSVVPEKITSEMLGKEWVDTITYYYFMGGDINWETIDVATFDTKDSILKLANAKEDSMMVELLEAA